MKKDEKPWSNFFFNWLRAVSNFAKRVPRRAKRKSSTIKMEEYSMPFLRVLRDVLLIEGGDTISWTHNGNGVLLLDTVRAKRDIFPVYFHHTSLELFDHHMQQNGFHRDNDRFPSNRTITNGHVSYFHPKFYYVRRDLAYVLDEVNGYGPVISLGECPSLTNEDLTLLDKVVAFNLKYFPH